MASRPQVLHRRRQIELLGCALQSAQPQSPDAKLLLEVGEQHLDLLPLPSADLERLRLGQRLRFLARRLVDADAQTAGLARRTLRLQRTDAAVLLPRRVSLHPRAALEACPTQPVTGRAAPHVVGFLVGEACAREYAVGLRRAVQHRDVRRRAAGQQPGQERTRVSTGLEVSPLVGFEYSPFQRVSVF